MSNFFSSDTLKDLTGSSVGSAIGSIGGVAGSVVGGIAGGVYQYNKEGDYTNHANSALTSDYVTPDATDTLSSITLENWDDFKTRFIPIIDNLTQQTSYSNPSVVTDALDQSRKSVNSTYNVLGKNQQNDAAMYGMNLSASQQAIQDRTNKLAKSTSMVDAASKVRQTIADRNETISTGTSNTVSSLK